MFLLMRLLSAVERMRWKLAKGASCERAKKRGGGPVKIVALERKERPGTF